MHELQDSTQHFLKANNPFIYFFSLCVCVSIWQMYMDAHRSQSSRAGITGCELPDMSAETSSSEEEQQVVWFFTHKKLKLTGLYCVKVKAY